jgi:hypothetical protein
LSHSEVCAASSAIKTLVFGNLGPMVEYGIDDPACVFRFFGRFPIRPTALLQCLVNRVSLNKSGSPVLKNPGSARER